MRLFLIAAASAAVLSCASIQDASADESVRCAYWDEEQHGPCPDDGEWALRVLNTNIEAAFAEREREASVCESLRYTCLYAFVTVIGPNDKKPGVYRVTSDPDDDPFSITSDEAAMLIRNGASILKRGSDAYAGMAERHARQYLPPGADFDQAKFSQN